MNFLVISVGVLGDDLSFPVGGNSTHVVVHGGEHRNRLLGSVNTSEDVSGLDDSWKALHESFGGQMVEVEVDVVSFGTNSSSLKNLHSHGAGDNVSRSKILGSRSIPLHKSLSVLVSEDTSLSSAALGHEAPSSVNSGRVELDKLGVLNWEAGSSSHTTTVSSAGVGGGAGEVGSSVAAGCNNSLVGFHSMNCSIGHVVGHESAALAVLHDEVQGEVLNEENAVVTQGAPEQGVQHAMAGSVGDGAAPVGLASLSVVLRLTSECSLIDFSFIRSGKRHTIRLELEDGVRGLTSHVVDGVLVSEPVGSLDGVVEVPSPVVVVHVSEGGVDTSLGSDGVGSGGEKFGDTGSFEASL